MHQVRRRAEISRIRQALGQSANRADCSINEIVWLRDHGMRVNEREQPRSHQGCGEFVIVIRQTLMGVAVEHHFDGVMVVVSLGVMVVFMESDGENRNAAQSPQQRADDRDGNEISSHDPGVSHRRQTATTPCQTFLAFVVLRRCLVTERSNSRTLRRQSCHHMGSQEVAGTVMPQHVDVSTHRSAPRGLRCVAG